MTSQLNLVSSVAALTNVKTKLPAPGMHAFATEVASTNSRVTTIMLFAVTRLLVMVTEAAHDATEFFPRSRLTVRLPAVAESSM